MSSLLLKLKGQLGCELFRDLGCDFSTRVYKCSCTRAAACAGVFLSHQGLVILVYIALNLGSRIPGCNSVRIASRI